MPEDAGRLTPAGKIGPNAILQLVPLLEKAGGPEMVARMMARAGVFHMPDGSVMIPEGDAARLHRQLRIDEPELAPSLAAEAGRRTAHYILEHRIPEPAQWLLKLMPAAVAARMLSRAIAKNAWTFAGSGRFRVVDPWHFEIADNPIIRGEQSHHMLCHWHAAVFETLYRALVHPACRCVETDCGAVSGDGICRFEITKRATA